MRRRLATLSVLFLIALMVQIIAPIAASWTPAIAASDSLSFAEVCHRGAASIKPLSRQTADRTPVASIMLVAALVALLIESRGAPS